MMHSLVKIFQHNSTQTETIDVSEENKYKTKVVDYLSWVNKMKIVLQAN